jgi:hypothetical protein
VLNSWKGFQQGTSAKCGKMPRRAPTIALYQTMAHEACRFMNRPSMVVSPLPILESLSAFSHTIAGGIGIAGGVTGLPVKLARNRCGYHYIPIPPHTPI